jgi:hypothetical protein
MKKLLLITVFCVFCFINSTFAGPDTVRIAWGANTEPDIAGYKVYEGISSGSYNTFYDVGNTTSWDREVPIPVVDRYYVVTAYDTSNNESGYSNEVSYLPDMISPGAPNGVTITIIISIP